MVGFKVSIILGDLTRNDPVTPSNVFASCYDIAWQAMAAGVTATFVTALVSMDQGWHWFNQID